MRRKYRRLFSSDGRAKKPGPKGPSEPLIRAIVELKSRNPRFGCPRIARIISHTFGIDVDKDVVRRVLATHYRPATGGGGLSWLSFIGHLTDSLWSVDLFRCESIALRSYWVLVVMAQRDAAARQVKQAEEDGVHTRHSVGHVIGGTQRCFRAGFSERIANARPTGAVR